MRDRIAQRYAEALADVVLKHRDELSPARVQDELRNFAELLRTHTELKIALTSPAVLLAKKRAIIDRLVQLQGYSRISRNFLLVLADHGRLPMLGAILEAFSGTLDRRLGILRAEVIAARELSESLRAKLEEGLSQATGRKVIPNYRVNPDLIGGVVTRIGSFIFDGSLKGQLEALKHRLVTRHQ